MHAEAARRSAFGEPGKLTISVVPAIPETPRESIPCGVCRDRLGAHRLGEARAPRASSTARVASGVTSSGVSPVPPVVKMRSQPVVDVVVQPVLDQREVVGDDLHGDDVAARLLGERGERRARLVLGLAPRDRRGDGEDRGAARGQAVAAGVWVRWAAAIRSRTAASSPARSSAIGSGSPLTMLLEERLAVLVGGQRALRPAADLVEQHGQARVGLAVLLGDLRA